MIDLTGKILVVVDAEPDYGKHNPEVVDAVELLVREARRVDSFVVFLEFGGGGTYRRLLKCVRAYDQFVQEPKQGCDGSEQVLNACQRGLYDEDAFVVCGFETHACVRDTAKFLADKRPGSTVEVVMEACGQQSGSHWDQFPRAHNLIPVSMA